MYPSLRFGSKTAALVTALLLVGTAGAEEAASAAPGAVPQLHKMTILNGSIPTVSYSVQGGSPHLQALVQAMQFTENELNLTGELQKLRLGIVTNEQTLDMIRTSQALGLGPISTPSYAACNAPPDSALKRALVPGLAREATPAMAYELINLQEQIQTELQAEQNKAIVAAQGESPARQNAQPQAPVAGPVAAPQGVAQQFPMTLVTKVPAQAVPQQHPMPLDPVAFQQRVRQNQAEVDWHGSWWPAEVVKTSGDRYYIHYTGWNNSWDEWVGPDRIRSVGKQ